MMICLVSDELVSQAFRRLELESLSFKIRHWNSLFDERLVRCNARDLFETVKNQFRLGQEDFAIYYFPPGPPDSNGGIRRTKLSADRIDEIALIGQLVHQPFLYLHSAVDNIDIPFQTPMSASSSSLHRRTSPPDNTLPKGAVHTPTRGALSPQPLNMPSSPPLSDEIRTARYVPQSLKNQVCAKNSWTCYICSVTLPATYEVDHIIPSVDGLFDNRIENLQALCLACHRAKTSQENHPVKTGLARAERNKAARAAAARASAARATACCNCSSVAKCKSKNCLCKSLSRNCTDNCSCKANLCDRR
jgi:hypothetical protein